MAAPNQRQSALEAVNAELRGDRAAIRRIADLRARLAKLEATLARVAAGK